MLIKKLKIFSYLLIFFSIFIHVTPLFAPPEVCELVEVDRRRVWCKSKYSVTEMKKNFDALKRKGYNSKKAVGVLGERYARNTIERDTQYVSITTLFDKMGCTVTQHIRDGADRGIDDIFVVRAADGTINRNYNPIFHEAKFDGKCKLKLATTKTLCQQLSKQWLMHHVKGTQKRAKAGAELCFGDRNSFTIKPCSKCYGTFLDDMGWLFTMLKEKRFHRTASVLCPNGQLSVYHAN
jgi:hypothetical protein